MTIAGVPNLDVTKLAELLGPLLFVFLAIAITLIVRGPAIIREWNAGWKLRREVTQRLQQAQDRHDDQRAGRAPKKKVDAARKPPTKKSQDDRRRR